MVMLIDTIAERYGMLPSEVITKATTFDVFIADAAIGYRNVLHDRTMNPDQVPEYSQEELLKILNNGKS